MCTRSADVTAPTTSFIRHRHLTPDHAIFEGIQVWRNLAEMTMDEIEALADRILAELDMGQPDEER